MANVSYNLFSSRHFFPIENAIKMAKENGCDEVQISSGNYLKDTPEETAKAVADIKACLESHNLTTPVIHSSIDHYKNRGQELIETSKELGCKALILPMVRPNDQPKTAQAWYEFSCELQTHVQPFLDADIIIAWHNHAYEFVPMDGSCPMDEIFRGFPELKFEMDIAWVVAAGANPVEMTKKYSHRLFALHIKDVIEGADPVEEMRKFFIGLAEGKGPKKPEEDKSGWCNIGDGIVPVLDVLKESKKNPAIEYFILEHDNPISDTDYVSKSAPKLKELLAQAGY